MKIKIIITICSFLLLSAFQTSSANELSAAEIKTLIAGKTIHAENIIKDFSFKVYFTTDGKVTRDWKGDIQEGTYSFDGNSHCINFGGDDKCGTIEANGDGTYKRLKNGQRHVINWLKFEDGKHL